jgi:acyl-CoA thioester hydrolase
MTRPLNDVPQAARRPSAPFHSSVMSVEPQWIDYNGHLNMAYYNVLFDRCVDQAFHTFGLGPEYVRSTNRSFFTAEAHVVYLRELEEGMPVYATFRLLDFDAKRVHAFQELYHAEEDWLSATSETMTLHVDMAAKRVVPWPAEVMARLEAMGAAHAGLPDPPQKGRAIGIRRKA